MKRKQTTILASSLLGLTLAVTGCSTANSQPTHNAHGMVKADEHPRGEKMGEKMHHWGDRMKGEMGGMKGGMMKRHMAELNLTDAQKTQVKALHEQHQAQMQQLKTTLKQYDDNIIAQKKAGASTATLLGLYQQKQGVMQQAMTLRQQHQQQFMSILTPEQQLKLYESRGINQSKDRRIDRHSNIKGSNASQPPMHPVAPVK